MPFQSFWMGIIIFISRQIYYYSIHIQYREFICTCKLCFWVYNNLILIRYGKHSNIKRPMGGSGKGYSISGIIRTLFTFRNNMSGLGFCYELRGRL